MQKYLSLTDHVYTPGYCLVGEQAFSKLPPEVQQTLTEVAQGMQDWVYDYAANADKDLLGKLSASMEVNEADKESFVEASKVIYDEFGNSVDGGAELIETILSLRQSS